MLVNIEEMQKAAKSQVEPFAKSSVEVVKGAQRITSEAAEQVGKSVERFASYYERLIAAKGVDEALRINSSFAATNLEHYFTGVSKMVECYASIAKDASAPVSEAAKEASNAVTNIASRSASEPRGRTSAAAG
jgi:hypothetical protein